MAHPAAASTADKYRAATSSDAVAVGVLLRSSTLPAWQYEALSRLATSGYARLVLAVFVDGAVADAPVRADARPGIVASALWRIIGRLEANMACERDALAPADASALLRDVPNVTWDGEEALRTRTEALQVHVDVFLDFAGGHLATAAARAARKGVWRVVQRDGIADPAARLAFWPVYRGEAGEVVVEQVDGCGTRSVVAHAYTAANLHSMRITAHSACWRVASLIPHKVRMLAQGVAAVHAGPSPLEDDPRTHAAATPPQPLELATYIGRNIVRRARASALRRFGREQWILLFRLGDDLATDPALFTRIVPPPDRFWADPHVMQRDGRFYVFLEELLFDSGKGHIAVLPIEADGTHGEAVTVLEREYHLSYPFVFSHDGELYMVPESEQNRTVDLYRCTEFPLRWAHVRTLMSGVTATDSTLLRHDGRWWMFTNLVEIPGASFSEELHVFCSDSLLDGEWTPHVRNPVISDARRARPAGAIIERNGRLYRPAQDCAARYGHGIRLHEILRLSDTEYEEKEVDSIMPTWDPRIVATHTLGYVPGLTVLDAVRPRLGC